MILRVIVFFSWVAFANPSLGAPVGAHDHELRFARDQIEKHQALLGDLTVRADLVSGGKAMARLRPALKQLDRSLKEAQSALGLAAHQDSVFMREHLRSSVLAMQDFASAALAIAIEQDSTRPSQAFKVSRTGQ